MEHTIKNLILEFVSENGSGHIKEIHLQITEICPEVPQHTQSKTWNWQSS